MTTCPVGNKTSLSRKPCIMIAEKLLWITIMKSLSLTVDIDVSTTHTDDVKGLMTSLSAVIYRHVRCSRLDYDKAIDCYTPVALYTGSFDLLVSGSQYLLEKYSLIHFYSHIGLC